jgi:hypothetical protein
VVVEDGTSGLGSELVWALAVGVGGVVDLD